jgi:hypothetical protein
MKVTSALVIFAQIGAKHPRAAVTMAGSRSAMGSGAGNGAMAPDPSL